MRRHGAFDDEEGLEQEKSGGDAEFTLGAGTLVLVLGGLLVVCGICFGLGYMAGRRGMASPVSVQQAAGAQTSQQRASGPEQKPSATTLAPATAPEPPAAQTESASQPASANLPESTAAGNPALSAQNTTPSASQQQARAPLLAPAPTPTPALRPAPQPPPAYSALPTENESRAQARPAPVPSGAGLWVQVAAVSHVEDAQVLTTALRKRGYIVTPRRESDNLIHVRIGPFNTRDEANHWSMKLLDDGYNAEVQE